MIRTAYLLVSTALLVATTGFGAAPQAAAPQVAAGPAPDEGRATGGEIEVARVARSRDGLFYLTLQVNDRPVRFLVDTGASMAVLSKVDAARAGVQADRTNAATMRTAGGVRSIRWAVADRLAIARGSDADIDIDYGPVEVAVADLGSTASLLGQNALSQLGTVTIRGDVMTVSTSTGTAGSGVRGKG